MPVVRRVAGWAGEHVAATLLGTLVAGIVAPLIGLWLVPHLTPNEPSIPAQLEDLRSEAARKGKYAVINRVVDLHGTGVRSHLVVFRSRAATKDPVAGSSDEIHIYDEEGKQLRREFDFQPERPKGEVPYRFTPTGIGHFDETDRQEVIGSFTKTYVDAAIPAPVAIVWDESEDAYKLRSLLARRPEFPSHPRPGFYGETARTSYAGSLLREADHSLTIRIYGVQDFVVRRKPFPVLVVSYIASARCNACPRIYELKAWRLDFQQPEPAAFSCDSFSGRPILIRPMVGERLDLLPTWLRHAGDAADC